MTPRVVAEKSVHINKKTPQRERFRLLAVRQGFEPWVPVMGTIDFESIAFDHSAISPAEKYGQIVCRLLCKKMQVLCFKN